MKQFKVLFSGMGIFLLAGMRGCDPQKQIDEIKRKLRAIDQRVNTIALVYEKERTIIMNDMLCDAEQQTALHPCVLVTCDESGYNDSNPTINYPYLKYKSKLEQNIRQLVREKQNLFQITESAQKLIDKAKQSLKSKKGVEKETLGEQIATWQNELDAAKEELIAKINSLTLLMHEIKRLIVTSEQFENEKKRYASEQIIRDVRDIKNIVKELKQAVAEVKSQQKNYDVRQTTYAIYRLLENLAQNQQQQNFAELVQEIRALRIEVNRLKNQLNNQNRPNNQQNNQNNQYQNYPPPYDQNNRRP